MDDCQFRLAPMDRVLRLATIVLLAVPTAMLAIAIWQPVLFAVAAFMLLIYAWVWLYFRPTGFTLTPTHLHIYWPCRQSAIERNSITAAHIISAKQLKPMIGWGMRIGAGGLWGGFGWLWTKKRGIVQMYISRTDEFIWLERGNARPWLITPENPQAFVQDLQSR